MKKGYLILLVFVSVISFSSCSSDDDNPSLNVFNGDWNGTFSGDNSGTWSVNISSQGVIDGFADGLKVTGTVSSQGDFDATVGDVSGGSKFTGRLQGNQGSGVWSNVSTNESGTWEGMMQ